MTCTDRKEIVVLCSSNDCWVVVDDITEQQNEGSQLCTPPEPELDGRLFLLLTWSVMDVVGMVPACRPGGQDKLSLTLTRRSREDKAFMACVHLLSGCVYTQPLIINRSINHLSIQLTDAFTWKEISS